MTVSPPSLLVLFICSLVVEDPLPYLYVQSPIFCPGIEKVSIPMIYLDFTLSCIILLGMCHSNTPWWGLTMSVYAMTLPLVVGFVFVIN